MIKSRLLWCFVLFVLLLADCTQSPESCPAQSRTDLSGAAAFVGDERFAFQFPLDDPGGIAASYANFCTGGGPVSAREYHAAEDYYGPPGTPVYAMADGNLSFSGPMGGYGWLIIVDHPKVNLYSLYGHLSPSRWRMEPGPVQKGELIAYLGDADENGGSSKHPLRPHLHLGIRAGQRADYPGMGEWRWQAGWIKPCPANLGWLQPSEIITKKEMPIGGFSEPASSFVSLWGLELLFFGIYLFSGIGMLIFTTKKDKPHLLVLSSGFFILAGWFFYSKGIKVSYGLFAMAIILLVISVYRLIGRSKKNSGSPT